ncbi:hypothetical protein E2562_022374 [Oryza meyeriana var. granulata]|uniref:Uncharacterized protein n=1 Tax=Oryza meyeriana var. granulata TaxID=110450 RepID=A0A6G1DMP8_9ORYZ|nr:hypothetical protein E2562_022374 [Oryza meyeriana var. granulata]
MVELPGVLCQADIALPSMRKDVDAMAASPLHSWSHMNFALFGRKTASMVKSEAGTLRTLIRG